jgi:hypothetical protein
MLFYPLFFIYHLLLFASVIVISPRVKTLAKQFMASLILSYIISSLLGLGVSISFVLTEPGRGWGGLVEFLYVTLYAPYIVCGGIIGLLPVLLALMLLSTSNNKNSVVDRMKRKENENK